MNIIANLFIKVLGDPNAKKIKNYLPIVEKINSLESDLINLTDLQLQAKTQEFRDRLSKEETLEDILPEAFAVVREAAKRTLNMRHFDVQLIGGMVLNDGKIAEMKTGEGKTLVATLPAYLNALTGKVYIVTVNDYLAKRDHDWMGQIYHFLGLKTGLTIPNQSIEEKRLSYEADIIFGTNNEFGFDYLRDNLSRNIEEYCQKDLNFAIVDEVDSILIDEARTPLIISGPVKDSTSKYKKVASQTRRLVKEKHYTIDEKHKNVVLTEDGILELERLLNVTDIFSIKNMDYAHMAVQSLKALYLFKRDVDYVIKDGEVMIVDEFTGRILDGRRYSDGLHQAIEAIENVSIKDESQTLASITFQNYFRMFDKLAGMTGTALTEEAEFGKIYNLEVVLVPTHMPMVRKDQSDIIFKSKMEKYKAIVREIKEKYKIGQPVLVGTITIEMSELLSTLLKREGVPHSVLNAKYHDKEAEIVAKAGQAKMVTIATNMAGRGTDIVLGEGVVDVGGLHIIGSERHESRRIDNQLRGRSGRQGDPGSSRFYVSLEDDLMRLFGSDRIAKVMDTLGIPADTPIEHGLISRSIERAQKKVEQYHFSVRKQLLEYDDVLNKQRETIYALRKQLLQKLNLDEKIDEFIEDSLEEIIGQVYQPNDAINNNEKRQELLTQLQIIFPFAKNEEIIANSTKQDEIKEILKEYCLKEYKKKTREYPEEIFNEVIKEIILVNLDRKWMDHLHNIDVLKEGIGLRAWGKEIL
jgi:preprotein translocase subunit SecA